jgi:hypothetical protein
VIVAGVTAATTLVVTVNVAVVAPAVTATLAGVVAAALSSNRVTVLCAAVPTAGAFKVTVPIEEVPPKRLAGFMVTEARTTGLMVSGADWLKPLYVPVIVTGVDAATAVVVTVNVALVAPAATATLAGVVEAALVSDSVTVLCAAVPAAGALRVTVPVEGLPAMTLAGFMMTETKATGLIVSPAVSDAPLKVAVTVTGVGAVITLVVMVNVAPVAPVGTTTLAGVVAAALSSDRVTVLCAAVPTAGAFKTTVPVTEPPVMTVTGSRVSDTSSTGLMVSPTVCVDPL